MDIVALVREFREKVPTIKHESQRAVTVSEDSSMKIIHIRFTIYRKAGHHPSINQVHTFSMPEREVDWEIMDCGIVGALEELTKFIVKEGLLDGN